MKNNDEKAKVVLKCYAQVLKDYRRLKLSMDGLRDCLIEYGFMEMPSRREFTQEDFNRAIRNLD